MSTQPPEQSGRANRGGLRPESSIGKEYVPMLEHNLASLKAEVAAGTPIDHKIIADLERQIERLKVGK